MTSGPTTVLTFALFLGESARHGAALVEQTNASALQTHAVSTSDPTRHGVVVEGGFTANEIVLTTGEGARTHRFEPLALSLMQELINGWDQAIAEARSIPDNEARNRIDELSAALLRVLGEFELTQDVEAFSFVEDDSASHITLARSSDRLTFSIDVDSPGVLGWHYVSADSAGGQRVHGTGFGLSLRPILHHMFKPRDFATVTSQRVCSVESVTGIS